ncbi:hypothetical protein LCGC14_3155720 [marine sediment metagenome]|uniref:Uncharacterized protein n=1 Tax=marine sediment metagenome TaxID=412755 RepID=A0A0F8VSR8_9ZZZZ
MLVIAEDSRGYCFAETTYRDGIPYTTDGRRLPLDVIAATQNNIEVILQGEDPVYMFELTPEVESVIKTLNGAEALKLIRAHGFSVNHELHLFRKMAGPVTHLRASHAKFIIQSYLVGVRSEVKTISVGLSMDVPPIPTVTIEESEFNAQEQVGGSIVMSSDSKLMLAYKEWCVCPINSHQLLFKPYRGGRLLPIQAIQEAFAGPEVLLTEEGYLLRSGESKLSMMSISAADF